MTPGIRIGGALLALLVADAVLWDSDDYEVRASVVRDGKAITEQPLAFSGEPNGVARFTVDAP